MSINSIAFKEAMAEELDKKLVHGAVVGIFADNGLRAKFIGAKTVKIPEVGMSGLGDYDRVTGFARGGVSVSATPFTLQMDRGVSFQIDAQDEDESGIPDLAGQIMGEFVRTKVTPEVDAYVLSKLAGLAVEKVQTVSGTLASNVYKMITEIRAKVQDAVGYDEELVCFLNGEALAALQNTSEISRHLVMNDFKKGEMHTQVASLDGMAILPAPSSRMKTAYTFHEGAEPDAFGFEPAENAKNIGILILPKRAASLVKKTEKVRTFTPEQNQSADAWQLDYRLYYDVVVKDSMAPGVYAYIY